MQRWSKIRFWLAVVLILSLALAITGCGNKQQPQSGAQTSQASQSKLKVAVVLDSPKTDFGFGTTHVNAVNVLMKEFPNVEFTIVDNIPEGSGSAQVFTQLCQQGYGLIIAASFGYQDSVLKVAQQYPNVKFLQCVGTQLAPNVSAYFGKIYQLRYLSGILAGKITKTNIIGYEAAFPVPACIGGIDAFTLGLRSVNPNAVVKVVWTNTWYDPSTERQAAEGLLNAGADIICMHQDTPQGLLAAAAAGKYGIGYDNNMNSFAPNNCITSLCWDWSKLFGPQIQSILNGTWKSQYLFPGMADTPGILYLAPYGPMVPDAAKQLVAAKEQQIVSGQWDVFTGPIKDQSGQIKVPAGQKLSDMDVWNIDWLVQGVQGSLPH